MIANDPRIKPEGLKPGERTHSASPYKSSHRQHNWGGPTQLSSAGSLSSRQQQCRGLASQPNVWQVASCRGSTWKLNESGLPQKNRCKLHSVEDYPRQSRWRSNSSSSTAGTTAGPLGATGISELMATLTGYCVLIGSLFRSIPQIIRIVSNKSVEGLSMTSFVSELVAYTVMWAYNLNLGYSFSTYGEIVACWFQDVALVGLVLHYRKQYNLKVLLWTLTFVAFMWITMTNACGNSILYGLQASTILMIALGARVPQIWMNYKRGESGELSLITCLLNVMGCFARMFTTIVLTKDNLNLIAAVVQAVLNAILLWQTIQTAKTKGTWARTGGKAA